jgi:hypothetical protein
MPRLFSADASMYTFAFFFFAQQLTEVFLCVVHGWIVLVLPCIFLRYVDTLARGTGKQDSYARDTVAAAKNLARDFQVVRAMFTRELYLLRYSSTHVKTGFRWKGSEGI